MAGSLAAHFLEDALLLFRKQKQLADRALAQVGDDAFFRALDAESNSIAVIVKHVAGNQRSRWRDFLTTDGEKPDRNRDSEFEIDAGATRGEILRANAGENPEHESQYAAARHRPRRSPPILPCRQHALDLRPKDLLLDALLDVYKDFRYTKESHDHGSEAQAVQQRHRIEREAR